MRNNKAPAVSTEVVQLRKAVTQLKTSLEVTQERYEREHRRAGDYRHDVWHHGLELKRALYYVLRHELMTSGMIADDSPARLREEHEKP